MTSEILAVFDKDGQQIGTKPRADVHRDGDWHSLVFVWCAWMENGQPMLLMQQRARPGDPFIGNLDAPAGGHVMASESHREAGIREFDEEVGILLDKLDLTYLGSAKLEDHSRTCNRVIQHFYLTECEIGLREVAFNDEVNGFAHVPLKSLMQLLRGETNEFGAAACYADNPEELKEIIVGPEAFGRYPDAIVDMIVLSLKAIELYLSEKTIDPELWTRL